MVVNGEVVVNEWCVVVFVNLSSSSSWLLSTREVLTLVCGWWWLSSTCGVVEGKTGGLTRHHHHASIVRTDHVTDPSPARTGTGTSRVIFFSPVPVPVTPVPAIPHGFLFPCPSLAGVVDRQSRRTSYLVQSGQGVVHKNMYHRLHRRVLSNSLLGEPERIRIHAGGVIVQFGKFVHISFII